MQIRKLDKKNYKQNIAAKSTGNSRFIVYSFRRNDGGQWRQRRSVETRKNAILRAKALYRTGKYQRVEVKKILCNNARKSPLTRTVKVFYDRQRPLTKQLCDALPSIAFASITAGLAMAFWVT